MCQLIYYCIITKLIVSKQHSYGMELLYATMYMYRFMMFRDLSDDIGIFRFPRW